MRSSGGSESLHMKSAEQIVVTGLHYTDHCTGVIRAVSPGHCDVSSAQRIIIPSDETVGRPDNYINYFN